MMIRCAILTVSDRSSRGERPDASGPALVKRIKEIGWQITATAIVADEAETVKKYLVNWCESNQFDLILTTGGTGFAPRDITPEATLAVIQRSAPGLIEAMRMEGLKRTPHAMLSRGVAGIRGRTLIINLPGSPKAAVENFEVVIPVLPHAVEILQETPEADGHHLPPT